jgi:hypothetical protein
MLTRGDTSSGYGTPNASSPRCAPSVGLLPVVNGVLGRLSDMCTGEASTERIDVSIGRGKTHNPLARSHLAMGGFPASAASTDARP